MKNRTKLILGIILTGIFHSLLIICLIVFYFWNPFLSKKMIDYYSDDTNFHHYSAIIYELSDRIGDLYVNSVKCIGYDDMNINKWNSFYVRIFANDLEKTWESFSPLIGMEFSFEGTFEIFFDGCPGAIVSISVDGNEILSAVEGKSALIKWAEGIY